MERLKTRVKKNYHQLTQGLKTVANFMMENPNAVALSSAKEIGNLTNTSETTVIRCCYALGYSGYSAIQEEIRKALIMPKDDPFKAFKEEIKEEDNVFLQTKDQDIEYIKQTFSALSHQTYLQAVNSIIKAEKILIVGLKTSFSPAHWLETSLNIIKGDTVLYKGDIEGSDHLVMEVSDKWLVIALSFQRYAQQTINVLKMAKEKRAKIITITDDELSPAGLLSDMTIKAITPQPTSLRGMPTIFSILNTLISGVMAFDKEKIRERIEIYDKDSSHYYMYFKNK
ncbi:MurR/RpiR family transcriptional regulator [Bacillaceae bacterium Marseille-Q3522]|nr:MurR/RpiR family transcriptional regulator [Bacillaceae bacterium Marseille-Q3522]